MKKGFTLIELLAVIVILAIIALIATPIVINIINDSKESSMLKSADFYLDAVELSMLNSELEDKVIKNGTYKITNDGNICIKYDDDICIDEMKVEVNGEAPTIGTITIKNGNLIEAQLTFNNKTIVKNVKGNLTYAYKESEDISIPDLLNGTLTPVIYNGENWIIADVTKKWYSYENQEWANAVILKNGINKKVGDVVTVDGEDPDALAMFVWIPRYEYKIEGTYGTHTDGTEGTSELPGEIEINFINKSKKQATSEYIIHPAFTFGEEKLSGIWVGKFEISHTTLSSSTTANNLGCSSETCEISDGLRILPNVSSLRYNNISNFFYAIRSMERNGNTFEIDGSITDTHMIKNSEWGAVVYLSQSKYGKYGNINYTGTNKVVYQNQSENFITGSGIKGCSYNNETDNCGIGASTTANIYGIYDMSGGTADYVMAVYANSDGDLWSGESSATNSGFKGKVGTSGKDYDGVPFPDEKYYDLYKASSGTTISMSTACSGSICYGHALSETEGWYSNVINFLSSSFPWMTRGGNYNSGQTSGIFGTFIATGGYISNGTVRVVLAPTT